MNLQSRRALLKQFAPQYREASSAQKRVLLDTFAQVTGYHRRYGMWLLNHAEDVLHAPGYRRSSQYGPEVQHAFFLVWNAANRICANRLMPFLPRSSKRWSGMSISTARAGTLLKQQIPIRTFEEWKETQPGFLEADLVAHCSCAGYFRYPFQK